MALDLDAAIHFCLSQDCKGSIFFTSDKLPQILCADVMPFTYPHHSTLRSPCMDDDFYKLQNKAFLLGAGEACIISAEIEVSAISTSDRELLPHKIIFHICLRLFVPYHKQK